MPELPYVFISYSSTDRPFVSKLADDLERRGVRLWWDQHRKDGIQPAEDWEQKIQDRLQECTHVLVVLSPKAIASIIVRAEIQTAFEYEKTFIPVMLTNVQKVPLQIKTVQYIDFRDPTTYAADMQNLTRFLVSGNPAHLETKEFDLEATRFRGSFSKKSNRPYVWIAGIAVTCLLVLLVLALNFSRGAGSAANDALNKAPSATRASTAGVQIAADASEQPPQAFSASSDMSTPTRAPVPTPPYLTALFSKGFEADSLDDLDQPTEGWKIETDSTNADNHVFCVTPDRGVWNQFNLAGSDAWADYSVEFRTRIAQFDQGDSNAGNVQVALRVQERPADGSDPSSYYAGLDALKHNTFFQKWTKETNGIELGMGDKAITTRQWYAVRVEIQGFKMRLFIDGELIQTVMDTSLSAGAVGIQVAPNSTVCVDDIVVRSLHKTLATTQGTKRGKLTADQDLLRDAAGATVIDKLTAGTEVFILEESADKQHLYVRDDDTALQGWLPAVVIALIT